MPDQRGVNKVERSLREGSKVGLSGMREKIGQVGAGRTMAVGWLGNEEISETQYSAPCSQSRGIIRSRAYLYVGMGVAENAMGRVEGRTIQCGLKDVVSVEHWEGSLVNWDLG
jgi:hypothetical protein